MDSVSTITTAAARIHMPVLLKKFFIVLLHQINAKALQQPGQQPNRQAHDVEKVAVNALHQQRALALHALGARPCPWARPVRM